jgi:Bacteriocin-protection, YdeI or OmpD-Associated
VPRFRAELEVEGKTATYIEVPLDVPAVFGRERPPVRARAGHQPRTVRLPKEPASALDDDARAAFDRMSYTHPKEYVEWIKEAKREETRRRRTAKADELIRVGKPRR